MRETAYIYTLPTYNKKRTSEIISLPEITKIVRGYWPDGDRDQIDSLSRKIVANAEIDLFYAIRNEIKKIGG